MLRYMQRLEARTSRSRTSMIPLGSCTMKLNATAEMIPVTWPEFGGSIRSRRPSRRRATPSCSRSSRRGSPRSPGFAAVSLQPNAGSQGEYAGCSSIRAYHESRGEAHRNVCLIPVSAHGTNPASAVMAGIKVVVVACDEQRQHRPRRPARRRPRSTRTTSPR